MAFPFFCPLDFNNEVTKKNTYSILASFSATLHQLLSNLNVHVMFCDDVITAVGFELSFDGAVVIRGMSLVSLCGGWG